jgi:hypothetical protein
MPALKPAGPPPTMATSLICFSMAAPKGKKRAYDDPLGIAI